MINGKSYGHLLFSASIVLTIAAAWLPIKDSAAGYSCQSKLSNMKPKGELSSLKRADAWLNSKPLTVQDLKGKVVLVQFWTYTCINWMRTLPYMRAWAEK